MITGRLQGVTCSLLLPVLCLALLSPSGPALSADKGDVNGDGRINVADVVLILRYSAGDMPGADARNLADVVPDSRINLQDAIRVLRYAVGLISKADLIPGVTDPVTTFSTSLHATGSGKDWWFSAANGGFEKVSGIPYHDLSCKNCHQPRCNNCHTTIEGARTGEKVAQVKCEGCHSRQMAEAKHYSDVHRVAGMGCMDCHTQREMHGDGIVRNSMLAPGAMDAKCENCHKDLPPNEAHEQHAADIDCSSCHAQSVVTCYNCHFESEVQLDKKIPYGQLKDWLFLVNRNGKVAPANFQSVSYQGKSFIAMAPFYPHTITREGRKCADCHQNPAARQYKATGTIDAVKWIEATGKLDQTKGIIPIVPDYQTAIRFDFVDLLDGKWGYLKTGADEFQLRWGEPLTREQVNTMAGE